MSLQSYASVTQILVCFHKLAVPTVHLPCSYCAFCLSLRAYYELVFLFSASCAPTVRALCSGRLVGNIRSQGTVKRTVIRGRVGARPAGMRLPPPMSSPEAEPASKAAPIAAKDTGPATDKAGDEQSGKQTQAVKDEDKVCNCAHLQPWYNCKHWLHYIFHAGC